MDEAEYPDLYRVNRISFLADWFGSDELLDSDDFFAFAARLPDCMKNADIIGIPDPARVAHEYRLLSRRGVPSSVNVLRRFGLLEKPSNTTASYSSNNVHMHLAQKHFFPTLWKEGKVFGIITSHRQIPDLLKDQAGINLRHEILVPGDSRNFWIGGDSRPFVQFPEEYRKVSSQLGTLDLRGVVFLVGAGFVGKQYLDIIKQRGGVALDIGAVANKWAREASVF